MASNKVDKKAKDTPKKDASGDVEMGDVTKTADGDKKDEEKKEDLVVTTCNGTYQTPPPPPLSLPS